MVTRLDERLPPERDNSSYSQSRLFGIPAAAAPVREVPFRSMANFEAPYAFRRIPPLRLRSRMMKLPFPRERLMFHTGLLLAAPGPPSSDAS